MYGKYAISNFDNRTSILQFSMSFSKIKQFLTSSKVISRSRSNLMPHLKCTYHVDTHDFFVCSNWMKTKEMAIWPYVTNVSEPPTGETVKDSS